MERTLTSGPELAEEGGSMPDPPHARRAAPALPGAPPPGARRIAGAGSLPALAFYAAVTLVLAAAGLPLLRVAAVGAVAALGLAGQEVNFYLHACRRRSPRRCVNADPGQFAWWVVLSRAPLLLTTAATVALTGGVRSPLLVTVLAGYLSAVAIVGERRQTRVLLAATALGVGALALLPGAWTAAPLSTAVHGLLAAASALGLGALLAPVHALVLQKREEAARARDELVSDALARARALEQIGAKVAHELKNPLTGVKALVQLGRRSAAEAASHARLEVVEREVTRMQEILQNYLSFTRPLQAMRPAPIALGEVVSDALLVLSARADDARVRLYAEGDATVEVDPRRLKEALLNLVANAIEATPPGGEVAVEVRPADDAAEITVRDTGRGMPADTLRRIGTPFFTTRDDGTGLGVVLARSVITQHGGSMRYDSAPGKGTRVMLTLPRRSTGAPDARAAGR